MGKSIDTFSYKGHHEIATIQVYTKDRINSFPKYICWEIVKDKEILDKISNYIKKVLSATGLNNGFAHSEVFITSNGDIKLIEINPRISGANGFAHLLANYSGDANQIELMLKKIFAIKPFKSNKNNYKYSKALIIYNEGGNMPDIYNILRPINNIIHIHQIISKGNKSCQKILAVSDGGGLIIVADNNLSKFNQTCKTISDYEANNWKIE